MSTPTTDTPEPASSHPGPVAEPVDEAATGETRRRIPAGTILLLAMSTIVSHSLARSTYPILLPAIESELLRSHAQVPPSRLVVISNGIDCTRFVPGRTKIPPVPDPARRWVICVSQARAEKRVDLILRCAARILAQPAFADVSFVYVGAGAELNNWRLYARDLGIADRVHFAGRQEDLLPWYQSACLMVHAAKRESFGLVLAEAMGCALPVVATASAGPSEIIADGETGRLIACDDEEGFTAAIEHYLADPALARSHGLAGRERVCRLYSIHRQASAIAAAIRRVSHC